MKYLVLAVCALVACGDDGGNDAGVDGPIQRPDGNMDIDLDGIKDDVDNCPDVTNGSQANEDADRFGDACDPCPVIADDNPVDGDGDRVADACDPKPIIFGDEIAFFEGFAQGLPLGWAAAGTWTASNGQLVGAVTGDGHFGLIVTDRRRETVSAKITITSLADGTSYAGVLDNKAQASASAIHCALTGTNIEVFDSADRPGGMSAAQTATLGTSYIVKLRREDNAYTCDVGGGASVTKSYSLVNSPWLSGLAVRGANIRVDWLMIVESL